jgi:hypothetical protein
LGYTGGTRLRARDLFVSGCSYEEIHGRTRVPLSTLKRWGRKEEWKAQRELSGDLERKARDLVLQLTAAAGESRDPQQAYAALSAARLAGLHGRSAAPPAAATVARALIEVLAGDPELGPILKKRKRELVTRVAEAAERLESTT